MGIEFKEIHRKIFFKGRRRYASCLWWNEGQIIDPPDLFKVGMESKRSDTSRFARELLDGVLRAWLVDGASIQTLAKTVRLAKEQMSNGTHRLEDIAFPSGLERQLEDYKGNNPRVRSRQFSNKYFGTRYYRGSHVKILYVKAKSSGGELDMFGNPKYSDHQKSTNCIAFEVDEDIPSDFWAYYAIDYDRMLKRNITNRLEAIFEAEGTTMDDALIGMKQATLF